MKKVVSLIAVLLLIVSNLTAKQVDQNTALQVATNFAVKSSVLKSTPTLELVYMATGENQSNLRSAETPLFYIYNISQDNGFVIISGDDTALPVLGYSETGSFKSENMPDNVKEWLAFYEREINYAITSGVVASKSTTQQWDNLLNGNIQKAASKLLSTVNWDQSTPYNNLCPMDGTKRSVTGCVATAMGIIMKYYQWPKRGIGSNSYTTATKKTAVSENFDFPYEWSNMLNTYTLGNYTMAQGTVVATLIYHAAVAVNMDFTATSSGAYTYDAVSAFVNNFGYDNSIYLTAPDLYTSDEWHALLQNELNNNRLIMYGGATAEGEGHQFVFDGYNDQNYYHINWGWSGIGNGYYLLSSLEPNEQGIGGSTSGAGFSRSQDAVLGIQKPQEGSVAGNELIYYPQTGITYTGINTTADKIVQGEPFKITFTLIGDYGMKAFDGKIGFFLTDKDGILKENLGFEDINMDARTGIFNKVGIELTIKETVLAGDKVAIYYTTDDTNWKKVRGLSGAVTELMAGDINPPVSNETVNVQSDINVYPTVAEAEITIQSTNDTFVEKVLVFDLTGRLMKEQRFSDQQSEVTLDVSGLKRGVHILSVQTTKGNSQYKIIKK